MDCISGQSIRLNMCMKLPKLKYYCTGLSPEQYEEFEKSRTLEVQPSLTIDPVTMKPVGRDRIYLVAGAVACDTYFRIQHSYNGVMYVLRIPADCIDRRHLTVLDQDGIFQYRSTLVVPHCGVERFEMDLSQQAVTAQTPEVIGSNTITISI